MSEWVSGQAIWNNKKEVEEQNEACASFATENCVMLSILSNHFFVKKAPIPMLIRIGAMDYFLYGAKSISALIVRETTFPSRFASPVETLIVLGNIISFTST